MERPLQLKKTQNGENEKKRIFFFQDISIVIERVSYNCCLHEKKKLREIILDNVGLYLKNMSIVIKKMSVRRGKWKSGGQTQFLNTTSIFHNFTFLFFFHNFTVDATFYFPWFCRIFFIL